MAFQGLRYYFLFQASRASFNLVAAGLPFSRPSIKSLPKTFVCDFGFEIGLVVAMILASLSSSCLFPAGEAAAASESAEASPEAERGRSPISSRKLVPPTVIAKAIYLTRQFQYQLPALDFRNL